MNKFFNFRQNNSGGIFYVNDVVAATVIIEANSESEAIKKFNSLDLPTSYCECCGERWSESCFDYSYKPQVYSFVGGRHQDVSPDHDGLRNPEREDSAIIYYLDGSVVKNYSRTDSIPGVSR